MARSWIPTLSITALLMVPATSFAGDSLLSGYGGPGGGEQVVLGAKLLPGGGGKGGGGGSIARTGATPPAVSRSAALPSGGPATGLAPLAAAPERGSRTTPATGADGAAAPGTASSAPLTAAPVRTRSITAGGAGSPLGADALLIVLLAALVLGVTAAGTRRLVTRSGPSGPGGAT